MKIGKFRKKAKIRNTLLTLGIVLCILVGCVILYRSYALYQEDKTYNILKGKIGTFLPKNVELVMALNGKIISEVPPKQKYNSIDVTCDNGATGEWDTEKWKVIITNISNMKTKCTINFKDIYTEDILNGADPVLADNLIPVTIADNGSVTKANTATEWYNYGNKVWANAVILSDKTQNYADGSTIPESNIESYFVWIPKYSYQIWDLGEYSGNSRLATKNQPINIKFGTTNSSDSVSGECTTPGVSGEKGNCSVGKYMTPPAFTTMGTNGIWVGKFETGYKGASSTSAAQVNASDATKVQIKPNVYSWRRIRVGNIFTTSYNYQRAMDSHMMKNTEWAVAAMLSHTQYGKGSEIWINNNSQMVTGCVGSSVSAGSVSVCANAYNTTNGYQGSSTGNISGIYDMSGGAWEYVSGYISGNTGSSGLTPTNYNAKYFDVYSASSYYYRILGDLTGELGPFANYMSSWYNASAVFVNSSSPWFTRGNVYSNGFRAGAFSFYNYDGDAQIYVGFRVVLAV